VKTSFLFILIASALTGCDPETVHIRQIDNQSNDTLVFTFPDSSATSFGPVIVAPPGMMTDVLLTYDKSKDFNFACQPSGDSVTAIFSSGRKLLKSMMALSDWNREVSQKPNKVICTFIITESDLQ